MWTAVTVNTYMFIFLFVELDTQYVLLLYGCDVHCDIGLLGNCRMTCIVCVYLCISLYTVLFRSLSQSTSSLSSARVLSVDEPVKSSRGNPTTGRNHRYSTSPFRPIPIEEAHLSVPPTSTPRKHRGRSVETGFAIYLYYITTI